jgi:hypothetical protein
MAAAAMVYVASSPTTTNLITRLFRPITFDLLLLLQFGGIVSKQVQFRNRRQQELSLSTLPRFSVNTGWNTTAARAEVHVLARLSRGRSVGELISYDVRAHARVAEYSRRNVSGRQ